MAALVGGTTRRPALAAFAVVAMLGCGGSAGDDQGGGAEASTTVAPLLSPSSTAPAGPPATRGPKAITFGPITLHTPATWDIHVGRETTTAYIGVLAGGPANVELRVMTDYTGTVDALRPTACIEAPFEPAASVEVAESGFAPVGTLTAEYRRWRFTCPEHGSAVEEQRAWLLPISRIAIVEQKLSPAVVDVVATAEVA